MYLELGVKKKARRITPRMQPRSKTSSNFCNPHSKWDYQINKKYLVDWEICWFLTCPLAFESLWCILFCPHDFALSSFAVFRPWSLACVRVCVKFSLSSFLPAVERSAWRLPGEGDPWKVAMVTPFTWILFTFACCVHYFFLTVGVYLP